MAHVFISYSSKHRDLTEQLATYLRAQKLDVWWDEALQARGDFRDQLHVELINARVVVVVWTAEATVSKWVKYEADYAARHDKIVHVLPKDVSRDDLPIQFQQAHRHRPLDHPKILRDVLTVLSGARLPEALSMQQLYDEDYRYTPLVDSKQEALTARVPAPTRLLQAKYGIVDFLDVHQTRDGLVRWVLGESEGARREPASGRLLYGPAGLGKTRLAIEVAAALRARGWTAGFLGAAPVVSPNDPEAAQQANLRLKALDHLIESGHDDGLCLIIDYAEGRQDELKRIATRILNAAKQPERPRVLILLTRELGDWWQKLRQSPDGADVASLFQDEWGTPLELRLPRLLTLDERVTLFETSVAAFARRRGEEPPPVGAAERARLTGRDDYNRPLAIQMEALLHVARAHIGDDPKSMTELLGRIVDLELEHWSKVLPPDAAPNDDRAAVRRAASQVTLVGGTKTRQQAETLLLDDPRYRAHRKGPPDVAGLFSRLHTLYGNGSAGLGQVEPDLIGEHLLLTECASEVTSQSLFDLVVACLDWSDGEDVRWASILSVLNRATKPDHGELAALAEDILRRLVSGYGEMLAPVLVKAAIDEPGGRLDAVMAAALPNVDEAVVAALGAAMPEHTVALRSAALALTERRVGDARNDTAAAGEIATDDENAGLLMKQAQLAGALNNLAVRESGLGRREAALAAAEEAVAIRRGLAAARPNDFAPKLAASLNNLGSMLSALGRREDALAAAQEAVAIRRGLAAARPDVFTPDLAMSLNNLANRLSALGRREDALAAAQEAAGLYRGLAAARPDAFTPDLAMSLNNVASCLSDLGRREDALAVAEEAVVIRRGLAAARPDAFTPNLAMSLGALSKVLTGLERFADAAQATHEGLSMMFPFAERNREAFGQLTGALARDYLKAVEAAGLEPDEALITRVAHALGLGADDGSGGAA